MARVPLRPHAEALFHPRPARLLELLASLFGLIFRGARTPSLPFPTRPRPHKEWRAIPSYYAPAQKPRQEYKSPAPKGIPTSRFGIPCEAS